MRKVFMLAALVVALTAGIASAGGNGSGKFDVLGPDVDAFCDGSGIIGTGSSFGFAVINAPADGTVEATVSLKGLEADTAYNVRLIQGGSDCFTTDATVTTNGQGNANAHISEPSVSTKAFVFVRKGAAGTFYSTDTYEH